MPNAHSGVQTLAYYIEMSFTVLFAPVGGVTSGCHSSNSQLAGYNHTCAILDGGGVKCWGRGDHGRLGYGSTDHKGDAAGEMASLGTVNLNASAIAITAGCYHTCAILVGGGVKCWGRGAYGQLGYDSTDNKGDAAGEMAGLGTVNLGASAIAIAAGEDYTCAILVRRRRQVLGLRRLRAARLRQHGQQGRRGRRDGGPAHRQPRRHGGRFCNSQRPRHRHHSRPLPHLRDPRRCRRQVLGSRRPTGSSATTARTTRATRPARWRAWAPSTSASAPSPSRPAAATPARSSTAAASSAGGRAPLGVSATAARMTRAARWAIWPVWAL